MTLVEKFHEQRKLLKKYVFERDQEIDALDLALLTKNHVFFLGRPGCAKTYMSLLKQKLIIGSRKYYNNCHSYVKPEEFVGPTDINALKNGVQSTIIDNHIIRAHVAIIDEVFKAHKQLSILLPVINERIFQQNGKNIKADLISAFMTSNELPGDPELEAFYNRILFKFEVQELQEKENRKALLFKHKLPAFPDENDCAITLEELAQAQEQVKRVELSDETAEAILDIVDAVKAEGIIVSNRQEEWLALPVQAEAWINGRNRTEIEDCHVLRNCLWQEPKKEKKIVSKIINGFCNQELDAILLKLDTVIGIVEDWQKAGPSANHREVSDNIRSIKTELEAMKPAPKNEAEFNRVLKRIKSAHSVVLPFAVQAMRK